jgi:hypothetical protein
MKALSSQFKAMQKELAEADGRVLAAQCVLLVPCVCLRPAFLWSYRRCRPGAFAVYHREEATPDFLQLVSRIALAAAPTKLYFLSSGPEKARACCCCCCCCCCC